MDAGERALVARAQTLVPDELREPGALSVDARRAYERIYRAVTQYDAPSLDGVSGDALLRAFRATTQRDRFLRERVAPLAVGMRHLMACAAPLGALVLCADALENSELDEVADLFAALAQASAALAAALLGAKGGRSAAAARFERTAAEARRRAGALADRAQSAPLQKSAEVRHGVIFIIMAGARGGGDDVARATNYSARLVCYTMLCASVGLVSVVFLVVASVLASREAPERLAALEVTLTGATSEQSVPDWLLDVLGIARAIEPSVAPPPTLTESALTAAGDVADFFAATRRVTAVVVSGAVGATGAPSTVQLGLASWLVPATVGALGTVATAFGTTFVYNRLAAIGGLLEQSDRRALERRLDQLQRQFDELRHTTQASRQQ